MRCVAIILALSLGAQAMAIEDKELTLNLDFFDVAIGTDCWDLKDNAGEMDRLMAVAAHYGVDRILFRVSICGVVAYHSDVMYTADRSAFADRQGRMLDTGVGNIPSFIPRMALVMEDIDPLRECVEACHRYGMECWAWVTTWDSKYYAPPEEFFQRHPEYTWVSRDGSTHIEGVPCYAYPQVREYRLNQMRELVREYDIDGIYLSMRSHSSWPHRGVHSQPVADSGARGYGYNAPVVAEYRRRYGIDPREVPYDSLEALRFVQLKAEFFKTWLADVHALTQASGVDLAMNTSLEAADPITAAWMHVPADDLAREHVVDELCIIGGAGMDMNRWRVLADGNLKTTTFTSIHSKPPGEYAKSRDAFRRGLREMLTNPTSDGACFHEFANVYYFSLWDEIAAAAR